MSISTSKNLKIWLIALSVIVVIAGLSIYRYSNSQSQQDVLKIGISPPYAELL